MQIEFLQLRKYEINVKCFHYGCHHHNHHTDFTFIIIIIITIIINLIFIRNMRCLQKVHRKGYYEKNMHVFHFAQQNKLIFCKLFEVSLYISFNNFQSCFQEHQKKNILELTYQYFLCCSFPLWYLPQCTFVNVCLLLPQTKKFLWLILNLSLYLPP